MMNRFLSVPGAIIFASFMISLSALCFAPPNNPATKAVVSILVAISGAAGFFMRTLFTGDEAQRKSMTPPALDNGSSVPPAADPPSLVKPKGDA